MKNSKNKKREIFLLILIIILASLISPSISLAGSYTGCTDIQDGLCVGVEKTINYNGLVPCGKSQLSPGESPEVMDQCQLCHFFVMLKTIIDFFIKPPTGIVYIIATFMLVIGGLMMVFSYLGPDTPLLGGGKGGPALFNQAKVLIFSVIIGLIIIFAAWIIINGFVMLIGVNEWTGLEKGWFQIKCLIKVSP